MFIVDNQTPFTAEAVLLPDKNGKLTVVTVVKAVFTFCIDGSTRISKNRIPLCYSDEYWGDPGTSSLRYASDMVYEKKGTDIALSGHVYAPGNKAVQKTDASLKVGSLNKTVTVWGDRFWLSSLGFVTRSRPIPFTRMPIRYERAFGGKDTCHKNESKHGLYLENPVGMGFRITGTKKALDRHPLPNFEDKKNKITKWADKPAPAGLGFIAPSWNPRRTYTGTCDDVWRKERMPFPPRDFDVRFHNAATPDLVTKKPITGKETVTLIHLHPVLEKAYFTLPGISLTTSYIFDHQTVKPDPVLDTLFIEPDENRFTLVFRSRYSGPLPWSQIKQVTIYESEPDA